MQLEWSEDGGSDRISVHRALPEGTAIEKDDQITYGIEMEFLVPFLAKDQPDPHPNDPRPPVVLDQQEIMFEQKPIDKVLHQIRRKIESAFAGEQAHMWADDIQMIGFFGSKDPENKKCDLKEDSSLVETAFKSEEDG